MTIKSYILKKYKDVITITKASTTNSVYITMFGDYKIRISDHIPAYNDSDMNIISLSNTGKMFVVMFGTNGALVQMSYRQIVSYVDSLYFMRKYNNNEYSMGKINDRVKTLDNEIEKLKNANNQIQRDVSTIAKTQKICKEYNRISADLYATLNKLKTNDMSINEFIDDIKDNSIVRVVPSIYTILIEDYFLKRN